MSDGQIDLPRDEDGRVIGYGVGKEANLREWIHRKQKREDKALFNRLKASKWQREVRAEGGERLDRVRATKRRYAATAKQKIRSYERKRRAELYRKNPLVFTCAECGSTWCKAPWVRGPRPNYCTEWCQRRARYHKKQATAGRPSKRCARRGGR